MSTVAERGVRKEREGVVVSNKMQKTIVVKVSRRLRHPVYGKEVTETKAKVGDTVRITETRPLSRLKRWRLVEVVSKSGVAG